MHINPEAPVPRIGRILPGSFQPPIVEPSTPSSGGSIIETGTVVVLGTATKAIAAVGQTLPLTIAAGQKVMLWFSVHLQQTSGDSPVSYEYQIWNETADYAVGPVLRTPGVGLNSFFPLVASAEDEGITPGTYQYSIRVSDTGSASFSSQNNVWAVVDV